IEASRQQRQLPPIRLLNEPRHLSPRRFSKRIIASGDFSHSLGQQETKPRTASLLGTAEVLRKLTRIPDESSHHTQNELRHLQLARSPLPSNPRSPDQTASNSAASSSFPLNGFCRMATERGRTRKHGTRNP